MKEIRHSHNITCPYCGHEDKDSWEVDFGPGIEGDTEVECGGCCEPFMVSRTVEVTYTSKEKEVQHEAI